MTPQGYQRLDGHRVERLTDNDAAGEHISVEIIGEYVDNKRVRECYVMRYYYDWRCVLTYYPDDKTPYEAAVDIMRAMARTYKEAIC